jgi:hypothetical protein
MEYWKVGILKKERKRKSILEDGGKIRDKRPLVFFFPHYSTIPSFFSFIIPLFHCSNIPTFHRSDSKKANG